MFTNGQGVPEDFIYAHMWFSISALNGNANGRKSREIIEKNDRSPNRNCRRTCAEMRAEPI
ncbi:hypothetical protein ACYVU7_12870 [Arenicellales bacterium IMCC56312]